MTATPKTKRNSRTWAEWMGPDAQIDPDSLMTRTEFIEALNRKGLAVTATTLAYWENSDVLPKGIRGRRNNAPQSLYPESAIPVVLALRQMQDAGLSLERIRLALKSWPDELADLPPQEWSPETIAELLTINGDPKAAPEYGDALRRVAIPLLNLKKIHERLMGVPVAYVELRIVSMNGREVRHRVADLNHE